MNKLAVIPILLLALGAGAIAYGVVTSLTYNVTVHDTTTYAPNIQMSGGGALAVDLNEGESTTRTITLTNTGNVAGDATLTTSSDGPVQSYWSNSAMSITFTVPAGGSVDATLTIVAPQVTGDASYTVTVSLS